MLSTDAGDTHHLRAHPPAEPHRVERRSAREDGPLATRVGRGVEHQARRGLDGSLLPRHGRGLRARHVPTSGVPHGPREGDGRALPRVGRSWTSCCGPEGRIVEHARSVSAPSSRRPSASRSRSATSKEQNIVFAFSGDASTSPVDFHEAVNFAAIHKYPPLVFVIENNLLAISTRFEQRDGRTERRRTRPPATASAGYIADGMDVLDSFDKTEGGRAADTLRRWTDPWWS